VTLLFRGRPVGTATVAAAGTFAALVPLPARAIRATDRARYQAVLGPLRSLKLKPTRRMRTTEISSRAATVTIAGRVTSPLARPIQTVTVRQYTDCTGTSFSVVKRNIKVSRDGRFRATIPAPTGTNIAYYRALTRVRKTPHNPKTYETFTLIRSDRPGRAPAPERVAGRAITPLPRPTANGHCRARHSKHAVTRRDSSLCRWG
jgi:hypothetical protein